MGTLGFGCTEHSCGIPIPVQRSIVNAAVNILAAKFSVSIVQYSSLTNHTQTGPNTYLAEFRTHKNTYILVTLYGD